MRLGLVGSEAAKFTSRGERHARTHIRALFDRYEPVEVVSGQCHLGGIDIWAIEEALKAGILTKEYPPAARTWQSGYRPRNIRIAERSTIVVCLTVDRLPKEFKGMRFQRCYHCQTSAHVKSGGCWTVKYARGLGKEGRIVVVHNG